MFLRDSECPGSQLLGMSLKESAVCLRDYMKGLYLKPCVIFAILKPVKSKPVEHLR